MAEKNEFERRREAFDRSWAAKGWNETIKLGDALRRDFRDKFQDDRRLIIRLSSAYYHRGGDYKGRGEFDAAIADFDKAIELKPDFTKAHSQRADVIGLKAAKRTEEQLLQSYNEQISSVTEPKEIEERFSKRKKQAFDRLKSLRSSSDRLSCIIIFTLPLTWALLAFLLFSYCTYSCDTTSFWALPRAFASLTLATLFLHLPIFLRLAHLNRNARIERHVLEDYERKIVILNLSKPGESVATILKHIDKRGTPEVLNRLYHPKYAYPQKTYEGLLKRLATLITTAIGKDK